MLPQNIFVTGIGTGIGKTVAAAVLCEALEADYWKPLQAGSLDKSDSAIVGSLLSNSTSKIHPESYRFNTACSPHLAAKLDRAEIELQAITLPRTNNRLVIEGAGGLLVPLTDKHQVSHLISHLKVPVLVVSRNYLGSINHTLLTIEALKSRNIEILGLIFNGPSNKESEEIIYKYSDTCVLGHLPEHEWVDKDFVSKQAGIIRRRFDELS